MVSNPQTNQTLDKLDQESILELYTNVLNSVVLRFADILFESKYTREIHITYRVFQTIQMKLILLCVWVEWAFLGTAKTALKFKF